MVKNFRLFSIFLVAFTLFSVYTNAQLKKGELVDGIAAVIGDEIVLESDVQDQMNYAKQQGEKITSKCDFLESTINNKLLIYAAKRDTLIENRSDAIKQMADQKYSSILAQFPDERTMLKAYNFRTSYEMKNAIEKIDADNYYGQEKYKRITAKADVTPNEVSDFYEANKYQLPEVKDEVTLSKIMMYPTLTPEHKQEIIDRLKKIRQDILDGKETFETMARIYSEDPGSASTGGLYTNIAKGKMVKPFEAAALNLQEGEISDPIESDFGFHIIQLVKKSGKLYDARHILLKADPNADEIASAKKKLDSIRTLIKENKMTFKEAAYKFSDDKNTKFNAGIMTDSEGGDKMEKVDLPAKINYQIAGLNKGDMTDVFDDSDQSKKLSVNVIMVNDIIPAHQLDINTDYERIKNFALNKKKGDMVAKWVREQLPTTFISLNKRYSDCKFSSEWSKETLTQ